MSPTILTSVSCQSPSERLMYLLSTELRVMIYDYALNVDEEPGKVHGAALATLLRQYPACHGELADRTFKDKIMLFTQPDDLTFFTDLALRSVPLAALSGSITKVELDLRSIDLKLINTQSLHPLIQLHALEKVEIIANLDPASIQDDQLTCVVRIIKKTIRLLTKKDMNVRCGPPQFEKHACSTTPLNPSLMVDMNVTQRMRPHVRRAMVMLGWAKYENSTVLTEQILTMLVNGKLPQDMHAELGDDLLGCGEYEPEVVWFTHQLFQHALALIYGKPMRRPEQDIVIAGVDTQAEGDMQQRSSANRLNVSRDVPMIILRDPELEQYARWWVRTFLKTTGEHFRKIERQHRLAMSNLCVLNSDSRWYLEETVNCWEYSELQDLSLRRYTHLARVGTRMI